MIQLINKCLHGFVLIPIIDACKKNNVFTLLNESPYSLKDLADKTHANPAYLSVALNAFESVGWIKMIEDTYILVNDTLTTINIPPSIINFYNFPFEPYFYEESNVNNDLFFEKLNLDAYLKKRNSSSFLANDLITFFLEGSIILPLFFFIKHNMEYCAQSKRVMLSKIPDKYMDELKLFFLIKELGTITSTTLELTNIGAYLMNSVQNAGVTLSYRPLLSNMEALIFGHDQSAYDLIKKDKHVDRTLNVIGSGAQHHIFFKDFQLILKDVFANQHDREASIAIVDMGCGDGSLLKRSYESVADKKNIMLVGVDFSNDSLIQTNKNLKELPCQTMRGDIIEPQKLADDLFKIGINNRDKIVHIRSFLDHNRPYKIHQNNVALKNREVISYSGKYISVTEETIPAHYAVQSLVESFQSWRSAIGELGLITLEVFSLPPPIIEKYLAETESLHFDTYHSFSKQLLVEAHVYMMAAAEAGLMICKKGFRKYPALLPYTRVSLQHFLPKPFIIRHAYVLDIPRLNYLKSVQGAFTAFSDDAIRGFMQKHPEEQYVLEKNHTIVGILFTKRVFCETLGKEENLDDTVYAPQGDAIIVTSFQMDPLSSELASDFLSFVIHNSFIKNGIKKVIILIKCSGLEMNVLDSVHETKNREHAFNNVLLNLIVQKGVKIEKRGENKKEEKVITITYTYVDWINNN